MLRFQSYSARNRVVEFNFYLASHSHIKIFKIEVFSVKRVKTRKLNKVTLLCSPNVSILF